jgi:hypothetical protein
MEVIKQASWRPTNVELFFYCDTEKREVDLVVEAAFGDIVAISGGREMSTPTQTRSGYLCVVWPGLMIPAS